MTNTAAALKAQFDLHSRLFNNALAGVTDTDSNTRNSDNVNHMKWIAGHLLNTRLTTIARITGGTPDETYTAQFGRGNSLDPNATYPPIEEITSKWKETETIGAGLSAMPEDALAAVAPAKAPIADESLRGLLAFLISHEAYHIGQLSILRKMVGKDAMSYN